MSYIDDRRNQHAASIEKHHRSLQNAIDRGLVTYQEAFRQMVKFLRPMHARPATLAGRPSKIGYRCSITGLDIAVCDMLSG